MIEIHVNQLHQQLLETNTSVQVWEINAIFQKHKKREKQCNAGLQHEWKPVLYNAPEAQKPLSCMHLDS